MEFKAMENFNEQFAFQPEVENGEKLEKFNHFVVVGMGGSHLAIDLLKELKPNLDITIHKNYGLPVLSDDKLKKSLIILSSYSGNTEEVLDAFDIALSEGLSLAVITTGGKLLAMAKENKIPFVQMPITGIQPRYALGFSLKAVLKLLGEEDFLKEVSELAGKLNPSEYKEMGKNIAEELRDSVPVIYASVANEAVAYDWKITFNETGKIPAFYNIFPELNHNEMAGFSRLGDSKHLSENFYFIFLYGKQGHPQIEKRMDILARLYEERGLRVKKIDIEKESLLIRIFSSVILANWAAFYTAKNYGVDPDEVKIVEEFKKLI